MYFCISFSFLTSVDSAFTFSPNLEVVKSIIFCDDVAQYFSSPLILGASHTVIVFFVALDSKVFSSIKNLISIFSNFLDENGMESATFRATLLSIFVMESIMYCALCITVECFIIIGLKTRATHVRLYISKFYYL